MPARGYEFYLRVFNSMLRSLVRYRVEHEKIKFTSTGGHVIFCLIYKHTNNDVFDDFPKISDHFPKIFQNCSEGLTSVSEHITNTFRRLPTISEGRRRFPRRDRRCFDPYSNTSEYFFKEYVAIAMAILRLVTTT